MKIDRDNPNIQRVEDLKFDSIRKHAFRFIPEKKQLQHEGDEKIPRLLHHLTIVNDFERLKRRHEIGLQPFDLDEVREDFRRMNEWMKALYGD